MIALYLCVLAGICIYQTHIDTILVLYHIAYIHLYLCGLTCIDWIICIICIASISQPGPSQCGHMPLGQPLGAGLVN
jgi:hypothetical protein